MEPADAKRFRGSVARLNYLAQDRPDLSLASCVLSTKMGNPMVGDEVGMKRVLRYLQGHPRLIIHYGWQTCPDQLNLYTDSDWASCHRTRRSKTGGCIMHGAHLLQFWCKQQDRIAVSSAEAELKAACKGVSELLLLSNIAHHATGRKVELSHSLDASACRGIMFREGAGPIKHLDIRQLWVQEVIRDRLIEVIKIPRKQNLADFLCFPAKEHTWRDCLMNYSCWTLSS